MTLSLDRRRFLAGTLGLAGAVVLGGCGDDDDDDDAGTGDTTTTAGDGGETTVTAGPLIPVSLGLLPITDVAPVFLARERGIFADHGVDVETTFAAGGAAILPSLESGEFDVAFTNVVSLLLLQSRGGAFKILAGGGLTATGDDPDYSQMIVLEDSPLESMADLEGKTVAINTLRNALEIVIRESVSQAGGDHTQVQFREIPFPEMAAALQAGQVDAIQHNEPFQTILQQEGGVRTIGQPFVDAAPGEILAFYVVKADNATSDLAEGFRDAMAEAHAFAAANEDEARAIIPEYTEISPEIAEIVLLPPWVEDSVRASSVEIYAELMTKYGLVEEMPDFEALLP